MRAIIGDFTIQSISVLIDGGFGSINLPFRMVDVPEDSCNCSLSYTSKPLLKVMPGFASPSMYLEEFFSDVYRELIVSLPSISNRFVMIRDSPHMLDGYEDKIVFFIYPEI